MIRRHHGACSSVANTSKPPINLSDLTAKQARTQRQPKRIKRHEVLGRSIIWLMFPFESSLLILRGMKDNLSIHQHIYILISQSMSLSSRLDS